MNNDKKNAQELAAALAAALASSGHVVSAPSPQGEAHGATEHAEQAAQGADSSAINEVGSNEASEVAGALGAPEVGGGSERASASEALASTETAGAVEGEGDAGADAASTEGASEGPVGGKDGEEEPQASSPEGAGAGAVAGGSPSPEGEVSPAVVEESRASEASEDGAVYVPSAAKKKAVAAAVSAAAAAPLKRYPRTEFGNADRLVDRFGQDLMYVEDLGQWYAWVGTHWEKTSQEAVQHLATCTVRALPDEAKYIADDEDRQKFLEFAARSQKAAMVKNMELLAKTNPAVRVKASELDKEVRLLGVKNGAVDLTTGALLPPSRDMRLTTIAAASYDPAAKCPVWEATVLGVFQGDATMAGFFKRLMGYTLLGQPKEDIIVIPYGDGSNGKSTTLGTIRKVLGGYARSASAATFMEDNKGGNAAGPREDVLRLRGARFVYVGEPEEGSVLKEGLVKSMTGGDAMPARGVHAKATVEVEPTWVPVMPTNYRPIIKGDDYAIWRRIMAVPFLAKFDKKKAATEGGADLNRVEMLKAEYDGILAWLVQGALEYQKVGLQTPESVESAKAAYREDMDLLGDWLEQCCELAPESFATNEELWTSWQAYAFLRGELKFIASSRSLGHRLANRFKSGSMRVDKIKRRGYWGLRVKGVLPTVDNKTAAKEQQPELETFPF